MRYPRGAHGHGKAEHPSCGEDKNPFEHLVDSVHPVRFVNGFVETSAHRTLRNSRRKPRHRMAASPPISDDFRSAFSAACDPNQMLTFERFMALALYDPKVGYYRKNRRRIGYGGGADFYTASSSG